MKTNQSMAEEVERGEQTIASCQLRRWQACEGWRT